MQWIDWILIGAIALIVGAAVAYIVKAKRSGKKCIGCPESGSCQGGCAGCAGACGKGPSEQNGEDNMH